MQAVGQRVVFSPTLRSTWR